MKDKKNDDTLPALPILPKSNYEVRLPPRCPLENIIFTQLRKIITNPEKSTGMGFGYDLIDAGSKAWKAAIEARDGPSKE